MSNTPIRIVMVGQLNTPPYEFVNWVVYNAPDNTGAQSGYPENNLINIAVDSVSAPSGSVNPLTLTVGGDLFGTLPNPTVVKIQGKAIASTTPTTGQTLTWNGTAWTPTTASVISAGGDLSGTYPNPSVVKIQGNAVSAALPASGQALIWNGTTWVPTTYTSVGGDLSGSLPNPTVAKIQTRAVSAAAPASGNALVWNGTAWTPTAVPSTSAGGDLSGTLPNPTVVKIQGNPISNTVPGINQALVFNGTSWAPNSLTVIGQVWAAIKIDVGTAVVSAFSAPVTPTAAYIAPGEYQITFPTVTLTASWNNFSGAGGSNIAGNILGTYVVSSHVVQVSCYDPVTQALADPSDPDDQLFAFVI